MGANMGNRQFLILGYFSFVGPGWRGLRWLLDRAGYADLVVSHTYDPGWVGIMLNAVINPPGWAMLPIIAFGLSLIWWDAKRPAWISERLLTVMVAVLFAAVTMGSAGLVWFKYAPSVAASSIMPDPLKCQGEAPPTQGPQKDRYDAVLRVVTKNQDALGRKVGCLRTLPRASRQNFQHSISLWMNDPKQLFVLANKNATWERISEGQYCESDWCYFNTPAGKANWKKLHGLPPNGLYPPFGAVAMFLNENPNRWDQFGWLQWTCELEDNQVMSIEFENGYVFGVYPAIYSQGKSEVAVLLNKRGNEEPTFLLVDVVVDPVICKLSYPKQAPP